MIQRISFAIATERASYGHFIRNDGMIAHIDDLNELGKAKVGIFTDFGPLNEAQAATALFLAEWASIKNPAVEITFGARTSPFVAFIDKTKQLTFRLEPTT